MELLLSACLGLGLSAACGFRIFVPFLMMSIASRAGHMELGSGFDWIASDAALAALAVATALEIGAYFVPWLDNLLDTAATPIAIVAGTLATAAAVTDASPMVTWGLAVIGGGGIAGLIQGGTSIVRGASSLMTAGFGNPIVSAAEAGGSLGLSALALTLPVLAILVVVSLVLTITTKGLALRSSARDDAVPRRL